jgi:hypothetical protein
MRTLVGAVTVAGVLLLGGCGGGDPMPTLPPTPSATPIFASEEEALAAAEDAYAVYQAAVDLALQTLDDSGLDAVATGTALATALESVEEFEASARHQVGFTQVGSVSPADLSSLVDGDGTEVSQVYACIDLSAVSVVSQSGETTQSPVSVLPMIVGLTWDGNHLLVAEEEVWDGSNFCTQ